MNTIARNSALTALEAGQVMAPGPVACPGGYWARRPVAFDAYGNPVRWSRPRFICP